MALLRFVSEAELFVEEQRKCKSKGKKQRQRQTQKQMQMQKAKGKARAKAKAKAEAKAKAKAVGEHLRPSLLSCTLLLRSSLLSYAFPALSYAPHA